MGEGTDTVHWCHQDRNGWVQQVACFPGIPR